MSLKIAESRAGLTLRARLIVSTIAAVALALAVGFVWARSNLSQVLVEQIDETLLNKHHELSAVAAGSIDELDREIRREIKVYERVGMNVRIDFGGRTFIAPEARDGGRIAARLGESQLSDGLQTVSVGNDPTSVRVFAGKLKVAGADDGSIIIAVSLDRAFQTLRLFDRRVALGGLTLLLIALPVGLWLYRQALRPVTKAVQAAQRLDPKDLSARLPSFGSDDELDQLSKVINELLDKLERHHQRVNKFTADASHELRTPLAAMRTSIDVALQRPRDSDEYRSALESLGEQCDRLTEVVEKLQLLARADAGRLHPKEDVVDLGSLVDETTEFLAPIAEERGLSLRSESAPGVFVVGDRAYLRQVLVNLVDNAIKFTPSGGSITVSVQLIGESAEFVVTDSGIGIAEGELDHLFERFYRSSAARSQKGSGLGLSICRSIVEAHGGSIRAVSRVGSGSKFTVTLARSTRQAGGPAGRERTPSESVG